MDAADGVPVTRARAELSDLVNRAAYAGERVVLTRHGRAVAAIVSAADLERLQALDAARTDEADQGGATDTSGATLLDLGGAAGGYGPATDDERYGHHLAPAAEWPPSDGVR